MRIRRMMNVRLIRIFLVVVMMGPLTHAASETQASKDVYFNDVEGICRVVSLDEIRKNDYNLNIPRYVEPVIEEESITIDQAITNLKESLQAAYAAEDRLNELLQREGLLQ